MEQGLSRPRPLLATGPYNPSNIPIMAFGNPAIEASALTAQPPKRKPKAPSKAEAEWARIKDPFTQLHVVEDKSLDETRQVLEEKYNFSAT